MIDRVYQTVLMLANSDVRGNMKPADFDKAVYNVILEKYEDYLIELNKALNRQNRGLVSNGVENTADIIRAKMDHYLTSAPLAFDTNKFILPSDMNYVESYVYDGTTKITTCKNFSEFSHLKQSKQVKPTISFPICFKIKNTIEVAPDSIEDKVVAYYMRKPIPPKWTYNEIFGAAVFNPDASDFQDIDIHPSEEDDIVSRLLVKFGINLKEEDLKIAGNNDEIQEENKKNSN
jgi:hypothetical protein